MSFEQICETTTDVRQGLTGPSREGFQMNLMNAGPASQSRSPIYISHRNLLLAEALCLSVSICTVSRRTINKKYSLFSRARWPKLVRRPKVEISRERLRVIWIFKGFLRTSAHNATRLTE